MYMGVSPIFPKRRGKNYGHITQKVVCGSDIDDLLKPQKAILTRLLCSVGNKLYIFGGSDEDEKPLTNSLISFDVRNGTWETLSPHIDDYDPDTPPPMVESTIYYYNGSLYILGGLHDDNYDDSM
ncbi:hypothetical protein RF11_04455 [Thelohanellus kitauei]|uniref:Uncharacterized protein n=1 Tax=Thelohanellus kitauei TaxID=669202 RepID=A0A0C2J6M2_THEKT|nr:hypothetical protein RF11_04455 [Thelohanellus kitauei]